MFLHLKENALSGRDLSTLQKEEKNIVEFVRLFMASTHFNM